MKKVRLHQYLSKTVEFCGKKNIYAAIRNGEISVNGKVTRIPGFQLRLTKPVYWKGKAVTVVRDKVYLVVNKPAGYLSSRLTDNDLKMEKRSVFSLLKDIDQNVEKTLFCVGRLDENTSGLLLITNDGNLSHKTANPVFEVSKEYESELAEELSDDLKSQIEQGVEITLEENGMLSKYTTKPCSIHVVDSTRKKIVITVHEGKKREIRRMMEAIGNEVIKLHRVAIGELRLDEFSLPEGHYKKIEKEYLMEKLTHQKYAQIKKEL